MVELVIDGNLIIVKYFGVIDEFMEKFIEVIEVS